MNWLLIITGIILLINAVIGMKAGFIKTIFSLVSLVLALVLTVWISPVVKDALKGNEKIYHGVSSGIEKILPLGEEELASEEQTSLIEKLKLPQSIKEKLIENNTVQNYKTLAVDNFKDYIFDYLTDIIINALSFILTFIVIMILLWIICLALDLVSKLPLLNSINKNGRLACRFAAWFNYYMGIVYSAYCIWKYLSGTESNGDD